MASSTQTGTTFKVLDAMDAPLGGRILRLQLQRGETPAVKSLRKGRFRAVAPEGDAESDVKVRAFAVFGGKPSDERLARTGRIDVHVDEEADHGRDVSVGWILHGPLDR
jgi:hypothetical protein